MATINGQSQVQPSGGSSLISGYADIPQLDTFVLCVTPTSNSKFYSTIDWVEVG